MHFPVMQELPASDEGSRRTRSCTGDGDTELQAHLCVVMRLPLRGSV